MDNPDKHLEPHEVELLATDSPAAEDAAAGIQEDAASEEQVFVPYVPQVPALPRQVVRGQRRRTDRIPFPLRSPLMFSLLFVGLVLVLFGWKWFTTPIENLATGESQTRGQQVQKFIGNLVRPKESLEKSFAGQQRITVLLIGLDHVPRTKLDPAIIRRNDSTLVASTDFSSKQIRLASLPRDGWVQHWQAGKNMGYAKFGHSYSEGQQFNLRHKEDLGVGGVARVQETVEHLLDIEVNHYVVIEFEGFIKLIDAMGGLEIDVEKNMKWDDYAGDLHINLKKGLQHLDGKRVMQYARFRNDAMSDKGRMIRQQKVIKLVLEKMATPQMLPKLPQIATLFAESVQTSLNPDQLLALAQHVDEYDTDEMESMSLPSYWAREPGHERNLPGVSAENQKYRTSDEYIAPSDVQKLHDFLTDLNAPPVVNAWLEADQGTAPFTVRADASKSRDRDGSVVTYEADWNGDGNFEEQGSSPQLSHEFPKAGEFSFNIRVLDDMGKPSRPQAFKLTVTAPVEQAAGDVSPGSA